MRFSGGRLRQEVQREKEERKGKRESGENIKNPFKKRYQRKRILREKETVLKEERGN